MELVVAEIESEGQKTPEADSDAEQDKQADEGRKVLTVCLAVAQHE